jgi:hypothetical protein
MKLRLPLVLILAVAVAAPAAAQRSKREPSEEMGTPEQRAACAPDVRRFCHSIKKEGGPFAYLNCLEAHREKLRPTCVRVIDGGQP